MCYFFTICIQLTLKVLINDRKDANDNVMIYCYSSFTSLVDS